MEAVQARAENPGVDDSDAHSLVGSMSSDDSGDELACGMQSSLLTDAVSKQNTTRGSLQTCLLLQNIKIVLNISSRKHNYICLESLFCFMRDSLRGMRDRRETREERRKTSEERQREEKKKGKREKREEREYIGEGRTCERGTQH